MKRLLLCVLLLLVGCRVSSQQSLDECLLKDSISCVQKSLFAKVREFLDRESLELAPGVSLVKSRNARSGKELVYQQEVDRADNVVQRQGAIENFIGEEVKSFVRERSLKINFAPAMDKIGETARAVTENIPVEVRKAADEFVEGRAKKKLLKTIIPLLLAAKLKIGMMATMAYFSIALIAKKAILASFLSIAISTFIGLKSLWANKSTVDGTTSYSAGWNSGGGGPVSSASAWSAPVSASGWTANSGWEDTHGSYSTQNQAYSNYHS